MNHERQLGSAVRWTAILTLFGITFAFACAGANGDPAPAAQEAGAPELDPCVDAGAVE